MQLHQLRYVVEVGRTGSISKAAENLFLTQPNLSNAVSELEKELGIQIFTRTNRGVIPTDDGNLFLSYASSVVNQMTNLERMYAENKKNTATLRFAWTISTAHVPCEFIRQLPLDMPMNVHLLEGTHLDVIEAVARREADIGAIFIPEDNIRVFERYAQKQKLVMKKLWKMPTYILASADSKLASVDVVHASTLTKEYIQMVYRPAGIYDLPNSSAPKFREIEIMDRNVHFNDRGTLLEILSACPYAYVQALCVDAGRLERHRLVTRPHTLHDVKFIQAILYHKQPLTKEVNWLIHYFEEMRNPTHPYWDNIPKPLPIE